MFKTHNSIDIINGPQLAVVLIKTKNADHLYIVYNHIIADIFCLPILFNDLMKCYHSILNGEKPVLKKKASSFKETAESFKKYSMSNEILKEVEYWKKLTSASVDKFPVDHKIDPELRKFSNKNYMSLLLLDYKETNILLNKIKRDRLFLSTVFFTLWTLTLKKWRGIKKSHIDMLSNGRSWPFDRLRLKRSFAPLFYTYPVFVELNEDIYNLKERILLNQADLYDIPTSGRGLSLLKEYHFAQDKNIFLINNTHVKDILFNFVVIPLSPFNPDNKSDITFSPFYRHFDYDADSYCSEKIHLKVCILNNIVQYHIEYNKYEFEERTIHSLFERYRNEILDFIQN
jgi:tyrocidine synthetase-2